MRPVCPCGQPVDGATLCARCVTTLAWSLANIAAYHADLDTLRTRQQRYGVRYGSACTDTSLGMDPRFAPIGEGAELDHDTRNTVTTWARVLHDDHPQTDGPRHDTVASCCAYLLRMTGRIRVADYGPDILDELGDLERRLTHMVDRPRARIYLGTCANPMCTGSVYAREGADVGHCDGEGCDAEYDVTQSRDGLERELDARLCTAAEIAGLSTYLGLRLGREQVRKRINVWHCRRRILPSGHTEDGQPLFRYGAVRVLLYREGIDTRQAG